MTSSTTVTTARWILTVSGPPIYRGWIRTDGQQILEVGSGKPPSAAVDLGDVAILPQWVNAHTHLEFSDLQKPIGEAGIALWDWIGQVVEARKGSNADRKAKAISAGIAESAAAKVCLVGEISTLPCEYPKSDQAVEWVAFAETIGLSPSRSAERFATASEYVAHVQNAAVSPHAPYSSTPELIDRSIQLATRYGCPVAMHVAESPAERELLCTGSGPFADRLKAMGVWQQGVFPWGGEPFEELIHRLAKAPRSLLVHGNDLRSNELDKIARHSNMTVVYCPRTHAFFGYTPHPVAELLRRGVPVALGTDSRASNPDLDLGGEVRYLLEHRQDIDPADVLRMATLHGANALGRKDLGRIEVGCLAKLAVVESTTTEADEVIPSSLIGHRR
ncbi:Aminodeoxyfutalosine deaminase [Planctomycetes bacterium CA13]|uniref:Aminodeoxyfutalosine deaminase n=1 Tax=Novipirellula herctigrandis TaxID=2527986 RepID=A0A5C5Z618_9BACT|nr:Aminodeoxyfutalosine deaminase [Planctomycetes bacterium CA13]